MTNLASIYFSEGKYAQAEALGSQTLESMRKVLGPNHPDAVWRMNNLACVYSVEGKYTQAEALFNKALEYRRRVLGPEHPGTLSTLSDMASMFQRQGKYAQAENYAAQATAGRVHSAGKEDPDTLAVEADLVLAYYSQGKFAQAEPLAREIVDIQQKKQPDDWQRFRAESLLGTVLAGQKKYSEAEPLLEGGYRGMMERKTKIAVPDQYHLDRAHDWIVALYRAWGKPAMVAKWNLKQS